MDSKDTRVAEESEVDRLRNAVCDFFFFFAGCWIRWQASSAAAERMSTHSLRASE